MYGPPSSPRTPVYGLSDIHQVDHDETAELNDYGSYGILTMDPDRLRYQQRQERINSCVCRVCEQNRKCVEEGKLPILPKYACNTYVREMTDQAYEKEYDRLRTEAEIRGLIDDGESCIDD